MNMFDTALLTILALGGLRGLLRGLIREVASLTALIAGGWLAFRYHQQAAVLLTGLIPPAAAHLGAFLALLILAGLTAHLLGTLLTRLMTLASLGWLNRLGGVVIGCLEGALIMGMVFHAVLAVPFQFSLKTTVQAHHGAVELARISGMLLDRARTQQRPAP